MFQLLCAYFTHSVPRVFIIEASHFGRQRAAIEARLLPFHTVSQGHQENGGGQNSASPATPAGVLALRAATVSSGDMVLHDLQKSYALSRDVTRQSLYCTLIV